MFACRPALMLWSEMEKAASCGVRRPVQLDPRAGCRSLQQRSNSSFIRYWSQSILCVPRRPLGSAHQAYQHE